MRPSTQAVVQPGQDPKEVVRLAAERLMGSKWDAIGARLDWTDGMDPTSQRWQVGCGQPCGRNRWDNCVDVLVDVARNDVAMGADDAAQ